MENRIFKVNIILILLNFIFISIVIFVFDFFSNTSLKTTLIVVTIVGGLYILQLSISKLLTSVIIKFTTSEIVFNYWRFFLKKNACFKPDLLSYSFKKESRARGTKLLALSIYGVDGDLLFRIFPIQSGWSEEKLTQIVYLLNEIGVEEVGTIN